MLKDVFVITRAFAGNAEVVDTPLFVVPEGASYEVVEVTSRQDTIGTNGGAVTMDVVKAASGTAIAGATSVLASTFNLKSTAATNVRKTVANGGLATAQATRTLTSGQALGVDFTGTVTSVAGLVVTISLKLVRAAIRR